MTKKNFDDDVTQSTIYSYLYRNGPTKVELIAHHLAGEGFKCQALDPSKTQKSFIDYVDSLIEKYSGTFKKNGDGTVELREIYYPSEGHTRLYVDLCMACSDLGYKIKHEVELPKEEQDCFYLMALSDLHSMLNIAINALEESGTVDMPEHSDKSDTESNGELN
jgi:hypothetical protein